jgi:CCR4-NOT complex subunit CAF16
LVFFLGGGRAASHGRPACQAAQLARFAPAGGAVGGIPELQTGGKLLHVVEGWLREEKEARLRRRAEEAAAPPPPPKPRAPLMPSKHMAFFR